MQNTPVINAAPSAIDFDAFRLGQNFGEQHEVVREITRVPVGKPHKDVFFQVHPSSTYTFDTLVLERKEAGELYLIAPGARASVPELVRAIRLHLGVDTKGNFYLIPLPLPNDTGIWNPWHRSLAEVLTMAMGKWLRISANQATGSYDAFVARGHLSEPAWPEKTMEALIEIAFRDRIIADSSHPVIEQLLGMV
jgi:hypothetical protein